MQHALYSLEIVDATVQRKQYLGRAASHGFANKPEAPAPKKSLDKEWGEGVPCICSLQRRSTLYEVKSTISLAPRIGGDKRFVLE